METPRRAIPPPGRAGETNGLRDVESEEDALPQFTQRKKGNTVKSKKGTRAYLSGKRGRGSKGTAAPAVQARGKGSKRISSCWVHGRNKQSAKEVKQKSS